MIGKSGVLNKCYGSISVYNHKNRKLASSGAIPSELHCILINRERGGKPLGIIYTQDGPGQQLNSGRNQRAVDISFSAQGIVYNIILSSLFFRDFILWHLWLFARPLSDFSPAGMLTANMTTSR